jgi:hypothetical protein
MLNYRFKTFDKACLSWELLTIMKKSIDFQTDFLAIFCMLNDKRHYNNIIRLIVYF